MKKISLTQDKFALVDDEDYEYLNQWKWHIDWRGYAVRNVWTKIDGVKRCSTIQMHSLINNTPKGFYTDHINRNRLDNQKRNLRTVTPLENARNTNKKTDSKTFKGVYKNSVGRWVVSTHINYNIQYYGTYDKEEFAARVYDYVIYKEFGKFAKLNFPNEIPTEMYNPNKVRVYRYKS